MFGKTKEELEKINKDYQKFLAVFVLISVILYGIFLYSENSKLKPKDNEHQDFKVANVSEINDKSFSLIDNGVNELYNNSFTYFKTLEDRIISSSEEKVVNQEDLKDSDKNYEIIKKDTDSVTIKDYLVPEEYVKISNNLKPYTVISSGFKLSGEGRLQIYNENNLLNDDTKEQEPLYREFYDNGMIFKEAPGKVTGLQRLPDEQILTLALLKTIPSKDLYGIGRETNFIEEMTVADDTDIYIRTRNANKVLFVNKVIEKMLKEKGLLKSFILNLKTLGIDMGEVNKDSTKAITRQTYLSPTPTIENILREYVKFLSVKKVIGNPDKIDSRITEKEIVVDNPLGDIVDNIVAENKFPNDNTVSYTFIKLNKGDSGNSYITGIKMDKYYNHNWTKSTEYEIQYKQDKAFENLIISSQDFSRNFANKEKTLTPYMNAELSLYLNRKYMNSLFDSISYENAFINYYDNIKKMGKSDIISVNKTNDNKKIILEANKVDIDSERLRSRLLDIISEIEFLNKKADCNSCTELIGDILQSYAGVGHKSENKVYDMIISLYSPLKFHNKVSFKLSDSEVFDKKFEKSNNINLVENLENTAIDTSAFLEKIKEERSKDLKANLSEVDNGLKEGNLKNIKDIISSSAFNNLTENDGYVQVLQNLYNKNFLDKEFTTINGKKIKLKELFDSSKKNIILWGTADCPFCRDMYGIISSNKEKLGDYNFIFLSRNTLDELDHYKEIKSEFEEVYGNENPNVGKNYEELLRNKFLFDAGYFADIAKFEYRPTLMYLNNEGYLYYVSSGVSTYEELGRLLEDADKALEASQQK